MNAWAFTFLSRWLKHVDFHCCINNTVDEICSNCQCFVRFLIICTPKRTSSAIVCFLWKMSWNMQISITFEHTLKLFQQIYLKFYLNKILTSYKSGLKYRVLLKNNVFHLKIIWTIQRRISGISFNSIQVQSI